MCNILEGKLRENWITRRNMAQVQKYRFCSTSAETHSHYAMLMNKTSFARLLLVSGLVVFATALVFGQTNVTTWHNDTWRDGLNSSETTLTQTNVTSSQFGKVCKAVVDGQIFGQPLVVNTGGKNIVYVGTMNDSVYEIDGTTCNQIAQVSLLQTSEIAVQCVDVSGRGQANCYTIKPIIGILGTPVIDTSSNTMYLVTETESTANNCLVTKSNSCFTHRLHALDLTTLAEKFGGPVTIAGTTQNVTFVSKNHIQRPGLLLLPNTWSNGDSTVYVGFSEMDSTGKVGVNVPRGWIFAYDAGNLANPPLLWTSTPAGEGGGIWMSGAGLAAGLDGPSGNTYIYLVTGDGDFNANTGGADYGDSVVKLTPSLTTVPNGYFTPFGQSCMDTEDLDFGSGGTMLIPDSGSTYWAVAAGKDKNIYVMNRANLGGYTPPTNNICPATGTNANQEYFTGSSHAYYTTPVYWNSSLFYAAISAPLVKYSFNTNCAPGPVCQKGTHNTSVVFSYGPGFSISSSGTTTGTAVIWGVLGNGWPRQAAPTPAPAVLYAYDAEHTAMPHSIPELWDSTQCPTRDQAGNATKFVVPTIANGFVYLGTMDPTDATNTRGELDVYGLTRATCD
jgi:hypothetical protein